MHNILKPYLAKLKKAIGESKEVKLINLIVLTNSVPLTNVELILLFAAKKLDKLDALLFQVNVQFFQVSNKEGAKEALKELNNKLSGKVKGSVRDIVNTITQTSNKSPSDKGVSLTSNGILKVYLGSVVQRLNRQNRQ